MQPTMDLLCELCDWVEPPYFSGLCLLLILKMKSVALVPLLTTSSLLAVSPVKISSRPTTTRN